MSWRIGSIENTVRITRPVAEAIMAATAHEELADFWDEEDERLYFGGYPYENEHADFVLDALEVLEANKVRGVLAFASVEGDNAGQAWAHVFDGEGGYALLKADIANAFGPPRIK